MAAKERIVRMKTVLERTALSRATIYRKIADGTFPRQVKISIHGAGWYESDIDRWIANPPAWRAANDNIAAAQMPPCATESDAPAAKGNAVAANDNEAGTARRLKRG
jgi:prophage regulatory protein